MEHAIEVKQGEGFKRVRLDVSSDNTAAIRVYESLGLQMTSRSASAIAPLEYCAMLFDGD